MKKKTVALLLACVMALGVAVGGTLAWLTATDEPVVNTFTPSTIKIELKETPNKDSDKDNVDDTWEKKMVPGDTLVKDPTVTVLAGSEACWLFIKVEETGGVVNYTKADGTSATTKWDDFLTYQVITGDGEWTAVDGHEGYYYRKVDAVTAGTADEALPTFSVIWYDADNDDILDESEKDKIGVKSTVTKEMMDKLFEDSTKYPKLTFQAAAVQQENIGTTVADAWAKLPSTFTGETSGN